MPEYAGLPQVDSIQCSKSILFIDCDAWRNTWSDRLVDILPIQKRTYGPPRRVQIIDHTRAIWIQNAMDILGLLRGPGNLPVQEYKVYYWKRGFNSNVSFDHLSSEVVLFEVTYTPEEKRDLILISYEQIGTEVATYYGEHLAELLDVGAHGYNRLIVYTSFELDQLAIQSAEGILKDIIHPVAGSITIEVQVRTLPTGLNR